MKITIEFPDRVTGQTFLDWIEDQQSDFMDKVGEKLLYKCIMDATKVDITLVREADIVKKEDEE